MTAAVVLALGSNLGNRSQILNAAVAELREIPHTTNLRVSKWQSSVAIGPEQPDYLNGVALLDTELSPRDLLAQCQRIEQLHGRQRTVRWGPRTLDIDIIDFRPGGQTSVRLVGPELELPHPRAAERPFVLEPWVQLDPQATLLTADGCLRLVVDLLGVFP